MTDLDIMKLARDALEDAHTRMEHYQDEKARERAITSLTERLAQPEQEPAAWLCGRSNGDTFSLTVKQLHELGYGNISIKPFNKLAPLYTTPPAAADQEPYGWVQPNPGFNSGIFNQGAACPYGWVGSAIAVYTAPPQDCAHAIRARGQA